MSAFIHAMLEKSKGHRADPRSPFGLYPVTIVRARYGGVYEGGSWLAFPVGPDILNKEPWDGGDIQCGQFFESIKDFPVGKGLNPSLALEALSLLLKKWDGLQ